MTSDLAPTQHNNYLIADKLFSRNDIIAHIRKYMIRYGCLKVVACSRFVLRV